MQEGAQRHVLQRWLLDWSPCYVALAEPLVDIEFFQHYSAAGVFTYGYGIGLQCPPPPAGLQPSRVPGPDRQTSSSSRQQPSRWRVGMVPITVGGLRLPAESNWFHSCLLLLAPAAGGTPREGRLGEERRHHRCRSLPGPRARRPRMPRAPVARRPRRPRARRRQCRSLPWPRARQPCRPRARRPALTAATWGPASRAHLPCDRELRPTGGTFLLPHL